MSARLRRGLASLAVGALSVSLGACRSRPTPPPAEDDELEPRLNVTAAAAPSVATTPPRCAAVSRGASFTIGEPDPQGSEDDQDLPFSVEIGRAASLEQGFALGALGTGERGTRAFVALIGEDGASGRVVELGLTHGTFEPPALVAQGGDLYLVVPDSDAGGNVLRLGVARAAQTASQITWGPSLSAGWDASEAFDLAVGKERGVVVWDHWDGAKEKGALRAVDFSLADVSEHSPERSLAVEVSAEGPRVVPRPGGFWLGFYWLLGRAPNAGKRGEGLDDGLNPVVELGRRTVAVVPLDEKGVPTGKPIRVAETGEHALVFELATSPDGAALLVFRDDSTSPGVEGGAVHVARVGLDGVVVRHVLEGDDVGAGAPALFADARAGGDRSTVWLSLAGLRDDTTLVALGPDGRARDAVAAEKAIGRGELLARRGDRLLVATPRGRSAEVSVLRCQPGQLPPPAASAKEPAAPPPELPE